MWHWFVSPCENRTAENSIPRLREASRQRYVRGKRCSFTTKAMGVEALRLEVLGFEVRRTGGEERRAISRSLRGLRCGRICIPFRVSGCSVTYPHSPTSPHAVPNDHDGEIVASKQRSLGSSQFRQGGCSVHSVLTQCFFFATRTLGHPPHVCRSYIYARSTR